VGADSEPALGGRQLSNVRTGPRSLPHLTGRHYALAGMIAMTCSMIIRDTLTAGLGADLMRDSLGYWNAGEHIRTGAQLYFDAGDPFGSEVFLFAPWFAWLWAPLTLLPKFPVLFGWMVLMLVATYWAVRPFFRQGLYGVALGCILGYALAWGALWGNVMPLLVGSLIRSAGRRSFPVFVGLAGSLKILPIIYMWPYAAQRRWREVGVALAIAGLLWAPALIYGLSGYPTGFSPTLSLLRVSGALWAGLALAAVLLAILARHSRWRWLTTSLAILALYPRLHMHYFALIGVGNANPGGARPGADVPA
jgi:hypothetical protein